MYGCGCNVKHDAPACGGERMLVWVICVCCGGYFTMSFFTVLWPSL